MLDKKSRAKNVGYVQINNKLRVMVEQDCLTVQELVGKNTWGKNKYYNSLDGVLNCLIRKFVANRVAERKILTFVEARKEILDAIEEVKYVLLGDIQKQMRSANEDIRMAINKFN